MSIIYPLLQFSTVFFCALFAGAALYISLVEHPAKLACGTELAATVFAPSYRRAKILQAALAALGFFSAIAVWWLNSEIWWLIGGVLLGAVIPFTLIIVMPTNNKLLDVKLDKNSPLTTHLLVKWGRLHAVRTILSLVALIIFILSIYPG